MIARNILAAGIVGVRDTLQTVRHHRFLGSSAQRRSSMQTKPSKTEPQRGFDAVAESRRWKEAAAAATAGMSITERMAWFRRQSSVAAIRNQAGAAKLVASTSA
ncbi:MAG: hypothetical protein Q8M07_16000 [Prosthecobacter sp.]|nr:hypothetical protein [Prosthecobacter sp.]